ncbi:MAG: type II toxin-antitoxin system VapC family toxin [Desulfococcaceae bacterium]
MKPSLIDTDILSYFMKDMEPVVSRFQAYLEKMGKINLSIVTYYEIISGLKHKRSWKKLGFFQGFVEENRVLPLTPSSVGISSDVYANLRHQGCPIDNMDLLIAGVAISNGLVLVTHNKRHFGRIDGLELADWSVPLFGV